MHPVLLSASLAGSSAAFASLRLRGSASEARMSYPWKRSSCSDARGWRRLSAASTATATAREVIHATSAGTRTSPVVRMWLVRVGSGFWPSGLDYFDAQEVEQVDVDSSGERDG